MGADFTELAIASPLDTPLHGGSPQAGSSSPGSSGLYYGSNGANEILTSLVPFTMPVAIDGHPYIVDLKQYQRTTLEAQRQPVDQSMEPGEQTLNTEGLWRRSQENFVLGCNQYYLDNIASLFSLYERAGENQSLRYRFWLSKNVNIWTSGQMTLLPLTEEKYTASTAPLTALTVGNYLYLVEGQHVWFTSNPTAVSPTWTEYIFQSSGTPANVTSVTSDGFNIYLACGANGVWKIQAGATSGSAKMGTTTPDFIQYGNGRLVTGTGPTLNELNADGTVTLIGAHKNASWFWTSGCSAPNAIYLGGSVGHVSEIYAVTIISGSNTTLAPPTLAAPMPPGEIVNAMCFTSGYLVLGTSVGLRLADITSATTNGLNYGPAITSQLGNNIGPNGVTSLSAWGDFVYFSWSKFQCGNPTDPTTLVQSSGLGRADLARFTSAGVPAFTTDLQIDDLSTSSTNWAINSVAVVNGNPYFTGINGGQNSFYCCGPNATKYAPTGMFQSGWTRYNTVEGKNVASIDYHCSPLAGGAIGAFLILESNAVVSLPVFNTLGALGPQTPYATNFQAGEAFQTQVYLQASANQLISPVLRRYTIRSLITPKRMDEIILPIIMKSRVEGIQGEGQPQWFNVLSEYQFLWSLCNEGIICSYQEGPTTYSVYIDRVQVKPEKWTDEREFFEGVILCRLLTIPTD